jgi:hypothetical protein
MGEATSFWNRGSFRSGSNIGSSRSSAGVSGPEVRQVALFKVAKFSSSKQPVHYGLVAELYFHDEACWSWGCVSAIDSNGRTIWIAAARIAATGSVTLCTPMKS